MNPALCHDALVIGAGPAGSTVAIALAKTGRHVVLIEKNKRPEHKVCGEFLSPESLPFLRRNGVDPETLGAQSIHSVRIASHAIIAEAKLPEPALSLTRRTLDEALLRSAQLAGVNVMRGFSAHHLEHSSGGTSAGEWRTRITDASGASTSIAGQQAFLATGKHDLRGWPRIARSTQSNLVALKMYFRLSPEEQARLNGHVELILYPGGYAGLQPVEEGRANLCALITKERLRAMEGRWDRVLEHMIRSSPHLEQRLNGSQALLERPLAISAIPYGYCVDEREDRCSPWRLGDQAAVIPSFCGEGMAIALYTADRAGQLFLEGSTSSSFHAEIHRQFEGRLRWTSMLSRVLVRMPRAAHAAGVWPSLLPRIFHGTRLPLPSATEVDIHRRQPPPPWLRRSTEFLRSHKIG